MKKIKEFIKENKVLIIGVGVAVVGGLVVYKLTKVNIASKIKHLEEGQAIVKAFSSDTTFPIVDTLTEAVDIFKEYQESSNTVSLFFENNRYSVIDLNH